MLHIVSFNVPYPANYGGVIDVFCRIRALAELGVDIHLHSFNYGRPPAPELEKYCSSVSYYKRYNDLWHFLSNKPYIVNSRNNPQLIQNLLEDDNPILLEGLHCCSVLETLRTTYNQKSRKILVRAHNVEHDYYNRLADVESNFFRRFYLRTDARRLQRYEPILTKATAVLAVTQSDYHHFCNIGCDNCVLMPSSHFNDNVVSKEGIGEYALYHADLSVPENIQAVNYLVRYVFNGSPHHLIVAGRKPDKSVSNIIALHPNVSLVANPDESTMQQLITDAQVNILVTNQSTGLKLKLLNSLYAGRHCLVNSLMVAGTPLADICTVADSPDEQIRALDSLMSKTFSLEDIEKRASYLESLYNNQSNARIIAALL